MNAHVRRDARIKMHESNPISNNFLKLTFYFTFATLYIWYNTETIKAQWQDLIARSMMLKCMSGKQTNRTELKQFIYGKIAHSTHIT